MKKMWWGLAAASILLSGLSAPNLAFAQVNKAGQSALDKIADWLPGGNFAKTQGEKFGNWHNDLIKTFMLDVLYNLTNAWLLILFVLSQLIDPLLIGGSFLTNPFVRAGWPFVLGIANLGFVLALLFIALSTIVGLGGFDARRALVRLLIAAVLINFSLLIAGIIIDISRLFMAVILKSMADINAGSLGFELISSSKIFQNAYSLFFTSQTFGLTPNIGKIAFGQAITVTDALLAMWLVAGVTVVFAILVVSLLTRWLMLVFLLIISPIAYLSYATPYLDKYARQWWGSFFSYVIYGPVVAFMLAIAVRVGNELSDYLAQYDVPSQAASIGSLFVTLGVIVLATRAGSWLGLSGAEKIAKTAAGVGSFARRHPVLTSSVIGGATFGLGAAPLAAAGAGATIVGAKVGKVAAKSTLKFGRELADEAVFTKINKTRDAMKRVAAGTAKPEDYKEVEESPIARTFASALSAIPGLGGTKGFGSKLQERRERETAANEAIDSAAMLGTPAAIANALNTSPALDPRKVSEFDHNMTVPRLIVLLQNGSPELKKIILQDPNVINKLENDSAGRAELRRIESAPTQREDRERLDINQVRIDLRDSIQRQQPGLRAAQLNQRVEDGLGAAVDLERRNMATRNQNIDAENEQRKNNKELIDAIGKAKDAIIKKQRGEF